MPEKDSIPNAIPASVLVNAQKYEGDASFGLTRAIPRPFHKGSFVFQANAAGDWVPQWDAVTPHIFFEHGINDNLAGVANAFINSGITGAPIARSAEFTNAQYNGGLSMKYKALLLGVGIVFEGIRTHALAAAWPALVTTVSPGAAPRAAGNITDNEANLTGRFIQAALHASELSLLPIDNNTSCPLLMGAPQLMTNRITGVPDATDSGSPSQTWRFRDAILVNPGLSGTTQAPNRVQLSHPSGALDSVGIITGQTPQVVTTMLALDFVMVLDAAFGDYVTDPATGQQVFSFASEFDARKYDCYQSAV